MSDSQNNGPTKGDIKALGSQITICLENSLPPNVNALAVALSGGPDSFALAHALAFSPVRPDRLAFLIVDHGLRPGSDAEAVSVANAVKDWPGVDTHIMTLSMASDQARVMEKARQARYEALTQWCYQNHIEHLYVAHHMDDQAETVLMRLAAGSGPDGLSAMAPVSFVNHVHIHRPFLEAFKKIDLIQYCKAYALPYVSDPTNQKNHYLRPRLRQSAAILAEEGLTPQRLVRLARRQRQQRDALKFAAENLWAKEAVIDNDRISFNLGSYLLYPADFQIRLLEMAIEYHRKDNKAYGVRRLKLESLVDHITKLGHRFSGQTLGGCKIYIKAGFLMIEREEGAES